MKPQEVELVLLEQSLANGSGMNRPFSDRVSDVAEKTSGVVLFDVRVDGDARVRRMAAVGHGGNGTVAIVMDKFGVLTSAPMVGSDDLIAELTAWNSLPMAEQARVSYRDLVASLLAEVRKTGILK
ncbi:hypothetical protein [Mesorhizobium loti]|uniref:Uncharacterized protein n=1 Tax=Mesorhizobium loti R88b TaxID=935548 RepID=A0A6M7WPE4_RHILI|nr:hypothetical protein [Mesorhizobium loti]QKD04262.1 hypothetical protein EB235_24575 [Mesorhizobium loti R88b]